MQIPNVKECGRSDDVEGQKCLIWTFVFLIVWSRHQTKPLIQFAAVSKWLWKEPESASNPESQRDVSSRVWADRTSDRCDSSFSSAGHSFEGFITTTEEEATRRRRLFATSTFRSVGSLCKQPLCCSNKDNYPKYSCGIKKLVRETQLMIWKVEDISKEQVTTHTFNLCVSSAAPSPGIHPKLPDKEFSFSHSGILYI